MGTIQIKNLSFRYDDMVNNIFNQFSLNIDESWKLGLISRNGRGKTTFLNLLLGKYHYYGKIQSNLHFNYFPQRVSNPTKSVVDVLMDVSGLNNSEVWKIQLEMDRLGLADNLLTRTFSTLSPGEQTKVLLATLFADKETFQLIDEPTNHLDITGRQVVANYLKSKRGFIVVSHDHHFIDQIIDHVLSIDRAKIQLFNGNYDTWQREFDRENQTEKNKNTHLQNEIKRLSTTANQAKHWADNAEKKKSKKAYRGQSNVNLDKGFLSHKSAKVMKRSKSTLQRMEATIDEKKLLLKNIDDVSPLTLNYKQPYQHHVLILNDFQVQRNQTILNKPITFDLTKGQRLVLEGPNGLGKTTLIKAILGEKHLIARGSLSFRKEIKVSYLTQEFENISGLLEAYAMQYNVELPMFLNMLRKLGFERSTFTEDLSELSMGQKRKISLARSLCEPANFYIWDEPLNYLDVITRQQIQALILRVQPTMLLIDHDRDFVKTIATEPPIELKKHHLSDV
ncbi:MAG: ribosomal protection-like ABC-F family protein [Liquorilactobacillus sp.]|uniref:ribosomal protection-like ABC-F family protein n=1 Tax=Liquorilactobacillus sp. TaxID=2767923 RepID=UPI0039ECA376